MAIDRGCIGICSHPIQLGRSVSDVGSWLSMQMDMRVSNIVLDTRKGRDEACFGLSRYLDSA